jgi:hypothetical protein
MKRGIAVFVVAFALACDRRGSENGIAIDLISQAPSRVELLAEFYERCSPDCVNMDVVAQVVAHAEDAAALLCIEDQVETFLAIVHRESHFRPKTDDGDSRGVAQVRRRYEHRLRQAWKRLGVELGSVSDLKTQVYMGMMMFRDKLRVSNGYVLGAVKAYNGTGDAAELYAYRVLASRGRMFPDKVWQPNERAQDTGGCP